MIKNISLILVGFFLGTIITAAFAITESGSNDASSIVGYGNSGSGLVAIRVDSTGILQTN